MNAFTLLLGGDLVRTPRLDAQTAGTRVIAADAGIRHAAPLGLAPELWVGDFDSVPAELRDAFPEVERRVFPADKDQTDGEIAIDAALALGATSLVLAGAFGGKRADHAFLHLALALRLAEAGIDVAAHQRAAGGRAAAVRDGRFDYADGTLFSILGLHRTLRAHRCRRQMAADGDRRALRLVADHLQRGQRHA